MTITLEKYKKKLLREIQKKYSNSYVDSGEIIIVKENKGFHISMEHGYYENITDNDINKISEYYIGLSERTINLCENPQPVNYHNIYPVIRNREFRKENNVDYIRKHFFLDLDIFIVEDREDLIWFYEKQDNIDEEKAFDAALFNVNRLKNELYQVNSELNIFGVKIESDFAASLMLNTNFKKQIREKVGKTFLLAIPSSSWIAVAPNQSENIPVLKEIIKSNDDPNIISSRVYRIIGDTWEYAD